MGSSNPRRSHVQIFILLTCLSVGLAFRWDLIEYAPSTSKHKWKQLATKYSGTPITTPKNKVCPGLFSFPGYCTAETYSIFESGWKEVMDEMRRTLEFPQLVMEKAFVEDEMNMKMCLAAEKGIPLITPEIKLPDGYEMPKDCRKQVRWFTEQLTPGFAFWRYRLIPCINEIMKFVNHGFCNACAKADGGEPPFNPTPDIPLNYAFLPHGANKDIEAACLEPIKWVRENWRIFVNSFMTPLFTQLRIQTSRWIEDDPEQESQYKFKATTPMSQRFKTLLLFRYLRNTIFNDFVNAADLRARMRAAEPVSTASEIFELAALDQYDWVIAEMPWNIDSDDRHHISGTGQSMYNNILTSAMLLRRRPGETEFDIGLITGQNLFNSTSEGIFAGMLVPMVQPQKEGFGWSVPPNASDKEVREQLIWRVAEEGNAEHAALAVNMTYAQGSELPLWSQKNFPTGEDFGTIPFVKPPEDELEAWIVVLISVSITGVFVLAVSFGICAYLVRRNGRLWLAGKYQ